MPKKSARRSPKKAASRVATRRVSRPVSSTSSRVMAVQTMSSPTQLGAVFLVMFVVNSIVMYLANMFFPYMVVLGNARYTAVSALLVSMFALTLILTLATPIIERVAAAANAKLEMMHWIGLYMLLNIVSLWTIARYAEVFGLGIASWGVVVVLAFVMNLLQGLAITKLVYSMKS